MGWKTIAWWGAGILFVLYFLNVSVPFILQEDGPVSLFLFGAAIGAIVVAGYMGHQRNKDRVAREQRDLEIKSHNEI